MFVRKQIRVHNRHFSICLCCRHCSRFVCVFAKCHPSDNWIVESAVDHQWPYNSTICYHWTRGRSFSLISL